MAEVDLGKLVTKGYEIDQVALARDVNAAAPGVCLTLCIQWIVDCQKRSPKEAHLFSHDREQVKRVAALHAPYESMEDSMASGWLSPIICTLVTQVSGGWLKAQAEKSFHGGASWLRDAIQKAIDPEEPRNAGLIVLKSSNSGHALAFCLERDAWYLCDPKHGVIVRRGGIVDGGFLPILTDVLAAYGMALGQVYLLSSIEQQARASARSEIKAPPPAALPFDRQPASQPPGFDPPSFDPPSFNPPGFKPPSFHLPGAQQPGIPTPAAAQWPRSAHGFPPGKNRG